MDILFRGFANYVGMQAMSLMFLSRGLEGGEGGVVRVVGGRNFTHTASGISKQRGIAGSRTRTLSSAVSTAPVRPSP